MDNKASCSICLCSQCHCVYHYTPAKRQMLPQSSQHSYKYKLTTDSSHSSNSTTSTSINSAIRRLYTNDTITHNAQQPIEQNKLRPMYICAMKCPLQWQTKEQHDDHIDEYHRIKPCTMTDAAKHRLQLGQAIWAHQSINRHQCASKHNNAMSCQLKFETEHEQKDHIRNFH